MDDELMVQIDVRDQGTEVVIAVAGELDFGSTRGLLAAAEGFATAGRTIVVDLAEVSFCDSSGLGALVRLFRKAEAAGGELKLARPQPHLLTVLSISKLDRMFEISSELPAAKSVPPAP
ncbi:STAS domain-containing protein [Kribbella sp. NPDC056861]|uniref:STAS domain-containing protein n=1 Tax=Kribbella sp. NPDC056861 TaxID=3154857 RepID=UPI00342C8F65